METNHSEVEKEKIDVWNTEEIVRKKQQILEMDVESKERILVVEDDWLTLHMIKVRLEKKNYDVVTAVDENEFWVRAFDPQLSLIILDICLGRHLGTDVYRALLDFGMDRGVPVIFMTGMNDDEFGVENKKVLREDGYSFMEKPFGFEKLNREIERLLHYRKMRGAA